MDVRASDTSNLAAQRIELERGEPVRERSNSQTGDQFAPHAAVRINGHVSRSKSSKNPRENRKREVHVKDEFIKEQESEQTGVSSETEHHVLDVRV